jgi:hypothetical protein
MVLNETGGKVWSLADGTRTVNDIAVLIASEFDAEPDVVRDDVSSLCRELIDAGALEAVT